MATAVSGVLLSYGPLAAVASSQLTHTQTSKLTWSLLELLVAAKKLDQKIMNLIIMDI